MSDEFEAYGKLRVDSEYDFKSPRMTFNQPTYSGGFKFQNVTYQLEKKPSFINRFFCKWCLGWEWVDQ